MKLLRTIFTSLVISLPLLLTLSIRAENDPPEPGCQEKSVEIQRKTMQPNDLRHAPKLVYRDPVPSLEKCKFHKGLKSKLVFKLLVGENGNVECVEAMELGKENAKCIKILRDSLMKWRYEPALNPDGIPLSFYWLVTINMNPTS